MKSILCICCLLCMNVLSAQNLGIGTTTPVEKLDVIGNIKVNGLTLNNGGSPHDFLMKSNSAGQVGFRKGHGALGLRYIICVQGNMPDPNVTSEGPHISEIKIFAGNFAPTGWLFCEGQIFDTTTYSGLYRLIRTTYGSSSPSTFGLPDLRGAVPIGEGTSTAGYIWTRGQ